MANSKKLKLFLGWVSFVLVSGASAFSKDCAIAQITPDGTLGAERSVVTPNAAGDVIQGGATRGINLFHSFEQFSVLSGRTVYFNNAATIQNIINRVTGSSISNIDGLLKANGTANLFLINPNGIVFGPNASLNIGGSFMASTANSMKFADGTNFSATAPQTTPLLTISVPIGLQFGTNPGGILVQGDGQGLRQTSEPIDTTVGLRVQPNQTLALVGGDVALTGGTLKTAGGRIELGSVAGPSLVRLTPINKGWALGYESVQNFQDIQLSQQAAVDASGAGGGDVQVQGRRVTLQDGSQVEASTLGAESGGTLAIRASDLLEVSGTSTDDQFTSSLYAGVYPGATGAGGNLTLETRQLTVRDEGLASTSTSGIGNAGNLSIKALDVELSRQGLLSTSVEPGATGAGGNLILESRQLTVRDGGLVSASTAGIGNAGSLAVRASDSVELTGKLVTSPFGSSLSNSVEPGAIGSGGNLTLETQRLIVQDGAVISVATFGKGRGGSLSVTANSVELSGRSASDLPTGLSARARSSADAGSLTVETEQLAVRNGAQITVRNDGTGNAGDLQLNAHFINLNQGSITAATASGEGGNIFLNAQNLQLRHNSPITASAGGNGNGGNITINTGTLAALESSPITANAYQGRGGNIQINAQGIFRSPDSPITASSQLGINGTVQINTPYIDLARAAGIPVTPPQIPQFSSFCSGRSDSPPASLVNSGTGGTPPDSSDSPGTNAGWGDHSAPAQVTEESTQALRHGKNPPQIVQAQGWVRRPNGIISLVAAPPGTVLNSSSPCFEQSRRNTPEDK